jgi:hypothetical protein
MTKYPDYSKMPNTLFNLADALRQAGNDQESVIYYARVVTEHPLSDRVDAAKQRLTALNQPIPDPNPVALARAQQTPREDRSIFTKMFGMFKSRPPVPTETSAATSAEEETTGTDEAPAPVRGGTASPTGTSTGGTSTFTLDPKVVDKPDTTKKPD